MSWRPIAAVAVAAATFTSMQGLMYPLLAFLLNQRGASPAMIGVNAAMTPLGIVVAALSVPRLVGLFGPRRVAAVSLIGASATLGVIAIVKDPLAWLPLRALIGFLLGGVFALCETWVNRLTPSNARGRVVGIYSAILAIGFALGPLMLVASGTKGPLPFAVGMACPLIALFALAGVRKELPALESGGTATLLTFLGRAPSLLLCVGVAAFAEQAAMSLLPIYALQEGQSLTAGTLSLVAMIAGSIVLLYPIGALSDRVGPRPLIFGCGVVCVICVSMLPLIVRSIDIFVFFIFIWGGVYYALYTLSLVRLGDEYGGGMLLTGNAAFGGMWGLGGLVGPVVVGGAMKFVGASGYPLSLALVFLGFLAALFAMQRRRLHEGLTKI